MSLARYARLPMRSRTPLVLPVCQPFSTGEIFVGAALAIGALSILKRMRRSTNPDAPKSSLSTRLIQRGFDALHNKTVEVNRIGRLLWYNMQDRVNKSKMLRLHTGQTGLILSAPTGTIVPISVEAAVPVEGHSELPNPLSK